MVTHPCDGCGQTFSAFDLAVTDITVTDDSGQRWRKRVFRKVDDRRICQIIEVRFCVDCRDLYLIPLDYEDRNDTDLTLKPCPHCDPELLEADEWKFIRGAGYHHPKCQTLEEARTA